MDEDEDHKPDAASFEDVQINDEGEILENRQLRYEQDCEKGYFLQPIYVQKLEKKVYFYDELVDSMIEEFRSRIKTKRDNIVKIKQRCREFATKDTMMICQRCKQDLAPLKTFRFVSPELHHATCVFGAFKRVEISEALPEVEAADIKSCAAQYDADDTEFVELQLELWKEE